jgi:hypothetical protein
VLVVLVKSLIIDVSFSETAAPATEAPATEAAPAAEATEAEAAEAKDELKEEPKTKKEKSPSAAAKVSRRLSARVGDFFKAKKHDDKATAATSPKVDEEAPKLEEPAPVAPLENPAAEEGAAKEETKVEETAHHEPAADEVKTEAELAQGPATVPVAPAVTSSI